MKNRIISHLEKKQKIGNDISLLELLESLRHIITNMNVDCQKLQLIKDTRWQLSASKRGDYFLNKQKSLLEYAKQIRDKIKQADVKYLRNEDVDDLKKEVGVLNEMYFRLKKKYVRYLNNQMPQNNLAVAG